MHIVVTGASSGIGRALAQAFDGPNRTLTLVARRKNLLEELARETKAETRIVQADLSDGSDPIGWVRAAEELGGPIDVLVNNAGTSYVEATAGIDPARIRSLFQINVDTPIAATQHLLPKMLARGSGTIVQIASNAAFSPMPNFAHYTATKGALANYSEALRLELRGTGVGVVTVYPGPVETPMADRNWAQMASERSKKLAPIGNADVLARKVVRAVEKRQARVIYPSFYKLGWYMPWLSRWIVSTFTPEVNGAPTPPLEGDRVAESLRATKVL
jgi:short-subunit dehydrogenase